MNYLKQYINLIRKAEKRCILEGYREFHHVFPKSVFGKNRRLVSLTAKEHYVAHALLEKIFIKRYGCNHFKTHKMIRAFFMMNNMGNHRSSRLYESNRIRFVDSVKGVKRSSETILKMRKPKHSEHGKLVSESKRGIKFSEEHRKSLSEAHKKRTHYAKGHKFTEEHKEKLKQAARNRAPMSEEHKLKLSLRAKEQWENRKNSQCLQTTKT